MVYYGLGYGVSELSGSIYTNNAINGALEAVAYCFTAPITDIFGRKNSLIGKIFDFIDILMLIIHKDSRGENLALKK